MKRRSGKIREIENELMAEVEAELLRRTLAQAEAEDRVSPLIAAAILACLALLAGTGIGLAMAYTPTPEDAAASIDWLQRGALGGFARALHWHAANLVVLLAGAYLFWLAWGGAFRRPLHWRWWRAAILLALVLMFSLTGQFLPYDQMAAHGHVIRLGYLAETPLVGGWLRDLATGGGEAGTAALSRTFALHVIVLPAAALILLRFMLRDCTAAGSGMVGTALAVGGLCVAATLAFGAPLGLAGDLSEPFPDARPEWFAVPLYELLKWLPAGFLHTLTLFAPPLLGGLAVVALPMLEHAADQPPRYRRHLRIALIAATAPMLLVGGLSVFADYNGKSGWFAQPKLDDLMMAMGRRNDALGGGGEMLPAAAHVPARDLRLLSVRMRGLYVKDIEEADKAEWDTWADKMAGLADRLITTTDDGARRALRAELRQICADCHDAHAVEDVKIDPRPPVVAAAMPEPAPRPANLLLLDPLKLVEARPSAIPERDRGSTKRLMNRSKFRLRDLLRHAGMATGDAESGAEQAFVDLREVVGIYAGQWEDNNGTFASQAKWDAAMSELARQIDELRQARQGDDARSRLDAIGKTCDGCHEIGDWDEPFEWFYNDLKR